MKSFYTITLGCFRCLGFFLCMISLAATAQIIHKAPQQKLNLKTTSFFERNQTKANQSAIEYAALKQEVHFDIYYPSYDSISTSLTQGIFWRIHQDFKPEEYIYFTTPYGEEDSLNIKFKNAAVSFNWLNDSFNVDSVTIAYEDAGPITIDTIFYFYGHANRSGTTNTLTTRIMPVNTATGQPILDAMPIWEDVFETDTSLTAPNDNPDSIFIDLRILPVNHTLTENIPFAVVVDFDGGDKIEDEFNLLATYNQPCGVERVAQLSKFYANSYYEFSALIGGESVEELYPTADLGGIGFDFDEDGDIGESEECENFYIQNWHIGTTVSFDANFTAKISAAEDTICKNEAIDLLGQGLFGEEPYTYNWSPADGLTQTNAGITAAAPSETTTYTLTVKDAAGEESKVSYTIYVNDLSVNLGDDVEIDCSATHQAIPEITNSYGNEVSYLWNHGEITAITTLLPGNYELTIEDGNCEATDGIVVNLSNAELVVDFKAENIYNAVVQFENLSENANFYFWDFGDGRTSSDQNPQHIYLSGGTYQVSLNASGGNNCSSTKYITIQVGTASSVYDIEHVKEIKIGPNPATDEITFNINPSFLKSDFEVMIYNMNGSLLKSNHFSKNTHQGNLTIPNFSNGIYFISFQMGSDYYQQKIVVIP